MSTPGPIPAGLHYRVPSLGWRITVASLRLIPLMLLFIGLPVAVLEFLESHSISLPLSIAVVTIAGVVITALSTARYIAKPNRLYGPLSIASSAFVLIYVFYILGQSTYAFQVPGSDLTVHLAYTTLIELLLLVPALALLAGVVTTVEDARAPRERLPYDYPASAGDRGFDNADRGLRPVASVPSHGRDLLDDVHPAADPPEYGVLSVEPFGRGQGDEELTASRVGARIGHGKNSWPVVP